MQNILSVKNLSIAYNNKTVVQNVNFELNHGEILAIVGESGSGKSTILKAVNGLLGSAGKISAGQILFNGREIANIDTEERRKLSGEAIAMIFQNAGASFCPIRTIGEQIYESVQSHKNWTHTEFVERATNIMRSINLDESVLNEYPFRLSGGMGQRAGILAAMILEPHLLLADEPTSALDTVTQVSVVKELLKLRQQKNLSILIVTHHMGVAYYMADKVLIMRQGQAVELGTKQQIFKSPREKYTQELIKAVPKFEYTERKAS